MSYLNFHSTTDASKKICRSCLSNAENMQNMFETGFVDAYVYCISLSASEGDGLPATLCQECVSMINSFYFFKQQSIRSYGILAELSKEGSLDIKEEPQPAQVSSEDDDQYPASPISKDNHSSCHQPAGSETGEQEVIKTEETSALKKQKDRSKGRLRLGADILSNMLVDEQGRFVCKLCRKHYMRKETLVWHIKVHIGMIKEQECKICGRRCSGGNLKRHMDTHTSEKPYKCDQCGKCFKLKESAKLHMMRHKDIKDFMCSICGKLVCSKSELRVHMEYHSTEKPHTCAVCSKGFKRFSLLTTHKKTHIDKRLYACSFCSKSFKTKTARSSHLLIHVGEKNHICQVCDRAFIKKCGLTRHLKTHQCQS